MNIDIKLGSTVRDAITGFTGIATQRCDHLNGNVQYAIQPKGKEDGSYPDAMFLDYHTLDVIDEGVSDRATPVAESSIVLGQKVRDKASGFTGIATMKNSYLNGCVHFGVLPEVRKEALLNENPAPSWIDHNRLEVVSDGLISDAPKTVEIKDSIEVKPRPPGGPAMKAPRGRC